MCAHPSMHRVKDTGSAARDLSLNPGTWVRIPDAPLVSCTMFYLSNLSLHRMGGNWCRPQLVVRIK